MDLRFETELTEITADGLTGFFVGWPNPPTPEQQLAILQGSYRAVLAYDGDRVVGFITAISDGQLCAYLPLLEVLPEYQGRGIGTQLVERMLRELDGLYMVDLCCDEDLVPFYERFGLQRSTGMIHRNYGVLKQPAAH